MDELLKLHIFNAHEEMTSSDKVNIVSDLLEILDEDPTLKPKGIETREWIAPFIGCKARTAQKYINLAKGIVPEKTEVVIDYSYAVKILTDKLCTKVKINKGKATIYFNDVEDLNNILERMGAIENI
ncbi:MAG: hypothetical protein LUF02_05995 [Erysipelotrichaceae bacterium]|nr:hypothetical protein [Erysipelotrichaceae bacterium]